MTDSPKPPEFLGPIRMPPSVWHDMRTGDWHLLYRIYIAMNSHKNKLIEVVRHLFSSNKFSGSSLPFKRDEFTFGLFYPGEPTCGWLTGLPSFHFSFQVCPIHSFRFELIESPSFGTTWYTDPTAGLHILFRQGFEVHFVQFVLRHQGSILHQLVSDDESKWPHDLIEK